MRLTGARAPHTLRARSPCGSCRARCGARCVVLAAALAAATTSPLLASAVARKIDVTLPQPSPHPNSGYFLLVTAFSSFFWAWLLMVGDVLGKDYTLVPGGLKGLDPNGLQKWVFRVTRLVQMTGVLLGVLGTVLFGKEVKGGDVDTATQVRIAGSALFLIIVVVMQPCATLPAYWSIKKCEPILEPWVYKKLLHGAYYGFLLYFLMSIRVCMTLAQVTSPEATEEDQAAQYGFTLGVELPVLIIILSPHVFDVYAPLHEGRAGALRSLCIKLHWCGYYLHCFSAPPEADEPPAPQDKPAPADAEAVAIEGASSASSDVVVGASSAPPDAAAGSQRCVVEPHAVRGAAKAVLTVATPTQ